jgi:hypothetical protein
MPEGIVDLTEDGEEPWCSLCMSFTDYRRKWQAVPRADLDGGTYNENTENPYCVDCGSRMYKLSNCSQLLWFTRLFALLFMLLASMVCFYLFSPTQVSLLCWMLCLLVAWTVVRIPANARQALSTYRSCQANQRALNARNQIEIDLK